MFINRLSLRRDPGVTGAIAGLLLDAARRDDGHGLIWTAFADDSAAKREFLYREDAGQFLAVSAKPPGDPHGLWRIETKTYDPEMAAGQRLRFALRANPTMDVRRATDTGKPRRVDVIMHAKQPKALRPTGDPVEPAAVATAWLARKGERLGFRVDPVDVIAQGYRQHRIQRRAGRPVRFSTIDFEGVLTVTDGAAFRRALFDGVGRAKAFGCGLLLIRRA